MIALTPHMRILVAVEPIDFRAGIDALAGACRQSPGVRRTLERFAFNVIALTTATHLDGPNNCRLVVDTPAFATRAPAYERFVDLDGVVLANGVAVGSHHPGAQLVKASETPSRSG